MWGFLSALIAMVRRGVAYSRGILRYVPADEFTTMVWLGVAAPVLYFAYILLTGVSIGIPWWSLASMLASVIVVNLVVPPALNASAARFRPEVFESVPSRLAALTMAAMLVGTIGQIQGGTPLPDVIGAYNGGVPASVYNVPNLTNYFTGVVEGLSILNHQDFGAFKCYGLDPIAAQPSCVLEAAWRVFAAGLAMALLSLALSWFGLTRMRSVVIVLSFFSALLYAFHLYMIQLWEMGGGGRVDVFVAVLLFVTSMVLVASYFSGWAGAWINGSRTQRNADVDWPILSIVLAAITAIVCVYVLSIVLGQTELKPIFEFLAWLVGLLGVVFAPLKYATVWAAAFLVLGLIALALWWLRRTWGWLLTSLVLLLAAALIIFFFFCFIVQREGFLPQAVQDLAEPLCGCEGPLPQPPDTQDVCGNYRITKLCPRSKVQWALETCKAGMTPEGDRCGCPSGFERRDNACGCVPKGDSHQGPGATATGACRFVIKFKFGEAVPDVPPVTLPGEAPDEARDRDRGVAALIDTIADRFKSPPCDTQKINITGRADKVGSNAYNCELSRKRAAFIYDRLVAALGEGRIVTIRDASAVCRKYEEWPGIPYDYRGEEDATIPEDSSDDERAPDRTGTVDVAPDEATQ